MAKQYDKVLKKKAGYTRKKNGKVEKVSPHKQHYRIKHPHYIDLKDLREEGRKMRFKNFARFSLSEEKIDLVPEEIYNSSIQKTNDDWERWCDAHINTTFR